MAKPGGIDAPDRPAINASMQKLYDSFSKPTPRVHVSELAAAMIDQCLNGITKDPLWASDLVEIGERVLKAEDYLR